MPVRQYQRLTIPGSLLLAGEYAVLEEGGLGLALAAEPRVSVTWVQSDGFGIDCLYETSQRHWVPEWPQGSALLDIIWHALSLEPPGYVLTIDSRAMSRPDGRKSGLGSSAAVTVGAVAALLYLDSGRLPQGDTVFSTALAAHREAQEGRGSGYDIACSTYGGLGLLHGGVEPIWHALSLDRAPRVSLQHAPRTVSTVEAITQWQVWRHQHPEAWEKFVEQSNTLVQAMSQCGDEPTFAGLWRQAADQGQTLGQAMGIWNPCNEAFRLRDIPSGQGKALGAGNELFAVLCTEDDPDRVVPARRGLQWS